MDEFLLLTFLSKLDLGNVLVLFARELSVDRRFGFNSLKCFAQHFGALSNLVVVSRNETRQLLIQKLDADSSDFKAKIDT